MKWFVVYVEDYLFEYVLFEGEILVGYYGVGLVVVWDEGMWMFDGGIVYVCEGYWVGKLMFRFDGEKLYGGWVFVCSGW